VIDLQRPVQRQTLVEVDRGTLGHADPLSAAEDLDREGLPDLPAEAGDEVDVVEDPDVAAIADADDLRVRARDGDDGRTQCSDCECLAPVAPVGTQHDSSLNGI
jgi:hypothetical protein